MDAYYLRFGSSYVEILILAAEFVQFVRLLIIIRYPNFGEEMMLLIL